jgi:uncharacterized protein (DUF1330 family)
MRAAMVYYTQLVYLKPGQADLFHQFEKGVLSLLEKHNGRMLVRWRRTDQGVIESAIGHPDEIHLLSFTSAEDFRNYVDDEMRMSVLHLKEASVERTLLIQGEQI